MKSSVAIAHNRDIENAIKLALSLVDGLPKLFEGRHVAIKSAIQTFSKTLCYINHSYISFR